MCQYNHFDYKGKRFMIRMEERSGRTYYFYINKRGTKYEVRSTKGVLKPITNKFQLSTQ